MTTVHQVIAAAAPGDAVTGQALAWQRLLRSRGHDGQIVAEHVHDDLRGRVCRLDGRGGALLGRGALVLHYSVWGESTEAALAAPGPLAAYYHNITPGWLLRPWNRVLADACDRARRELPRIAARAEALIAVSRFNADELAKAGGRGAVVVPLLLDRPAPGPPRPPADAPLVLSVGRIVPNKRLDDVIRAFALFQQNRAPDASLVLVGGAEGFEGYAAALKGLVQRVGAKRVLMTGRVSDEERDAWYRRAHAYLCMSAHEGFCAPLVEAMGHRVPIVARAAAGVPETVGPAGILVDDDLPLAAEALHEVVTSASTRTALAAAAASRLAAFAPATLEERVLSALAPVLGDQ